MANVIQNAELNGSISLPPLPCSREGGGGWVPIYNMQNYRISTKSLCGREITCLSPQKDENSIANPHVKRAEGDRAQYFPTFGKY